MESIIEEMVREILLKLPTRDVARCRCVSSQWLRLLTDPSFIHLHVHASHVVSGSGVQALVAMETRGPRIGLEMVIFDVSSRKPMCRVTNLSTCYRPANACNGFLLLASTVKDKPVYLCNPITGEKQKISPPLETQDIYHRVYAMGFSPSSGLYKLFRLCFRDSASQSETCDNYMEMYTFGDKGGGSWRRNPHTFPCSLYRVRQMPPVLLDGKLYVLTGRLENNRRVLVLELDRMLVIDVATEAHCTFHLPENFLGEVRSSVHAFDMGGRLCIARRTASTKLLHFWVMEPLRGQQLDHKKDRCRYGRWELRYTFYVNECGGRYDEKASGAWLDNGDGMLHYRFGDCLYIYDTTKDAERRKMMKNVGDLSAWDDQIPLSMAPSCDDQRWNVYGGYRPSLFSPHNLVHGRNGDEQEKYEHDLAQPQRYEQSLMKRMGPPNSSVHPIRGIKRVRETTTPNFN